MEEIVTIRNHRFREIMDKISRAKILLATCREGYRPPFHGEIYMTGEELMKLLCLSKRTLQDYRDKKIIPYTSIGGKLLYRESDLTRIFDRNYKPERTPDLWE